jgi:hypothetical protein
MRKVIAGLFITLDGVVESPDKWQEHMELFLSAKSAITPVDHDVFSPALWPSFMISQIPLAEKILPFPPFIQEVQRCTS